MYEKADKSTEVNIQRFVNLSDASIDEIITDRLNTPKKMLSVMFVFLNVSFIFLRMFI